MKVIVQLIRILLEGIADLDERIEEAAAAHPDLEREKAVDPFSLGLPQVSAAEFS